MWGWGRYGGLQESSYICYVDTEQSISYNSSDKKLYPFFCRTLGLDLVVRDPEGNIINPDSTGAIQLYRRVRPAKLILYHCCDHLLIIFQTLRNVYEPMRQVLLCSLWKILWLLIYSKLHGKNDLLITYM